MKKYTHAWLAMMAMKRIEKAAIPAKQAEDAKSLIKWFKDYRDFVISGSWYPDSVFRDMGVSHILKYQPDKDPKEVKFRRMPDTLSMFKLGVDNPLYGKSFSILDGNLCDRCESFTESLIDSFKILDSENAGEPIVPSCNHIAMRFFILSHYIADCHMPLHCDARSFARSNEVHGFIEEEWDNQVQTSYLVDVANNRFYYDPDGYPLQRDGMTPLMKKVEKELVSREFVWTWGPDCKNTWDYMSGISQYSYLLAYKLVPADKKPSEITTAYYKTTDAYKKHFEEYSAAILCDAVESIAKIWLHAWCRYQDWWRGSILAGLREETRNAESDLKKAQKIIDKNPALITELEAKVKSATTKSATEKNQVKLDAAKAELTQATESIEQLETLYQAARLKEAITTKQYSK